MKVCLYLGYAAIIKAAKILGLKVDCASIAENVLDTKKMPEISMCGAFEEAAADAQEKVLAAGLGYLADNIAYKLLE